MFVDCSRLLFESDCMITPGDFVSDLVNEMEQHMIDLWGDGTDGEGKIGRRFLRAMQATY